MLLGKSRKRIADRTRASQAIRWLDPIVLVGNGDVSEQESSLCQRVAHRAIRAYLPGQGTWQPREAVVQRLNMKTTSRDIGLNPRVKPFRITRQHNDLHVNDDGRWHPPMYSRKGRDASRGPSPLFQVQAPGEIEKEYTSFKYRASSDLLGGWSSEYLYSNKYELVYDESMSESDNSDDHLGQYEEVRAVIID